MPTSPAQSDHPTPRTDAEVEVEVEVDAAVHRFMAELTGVSAPPGTAARCYQHAAAAIAEEVTEVLATLANPR